MKVCVAGLWHLGSVTAACLAEAGNDVVGWDPDHTVVEKLAAGCPPVREPGLEDLVRKGIAGGGLRFEADPSAALSKAEVVWVTFDTPVDEQDRADVDYVIRQVMSLFSHFPRGVDVVVSSQLPVGTVGHLERQYAEKCPGGVAQFAASPENLRLGKAIEAFMKPDRVVVGIRPGADRSRMVDLLRPFTEKIEWMKVESAEMTKHALNGFLATSVAFANEIAGLCEAIGADAREVARGLKSDGRIGPGAYLSPGAAFAGGTLARDIVFLSQRGEDLGRRTLVIRAVRESNEAHRQWMRDRVEEVLGASMSASRAAVWGLAYKSGTDTLRRSASVELCRWLAGRGVAVSAFDPMVRSLPSELIGILTLCSSPAEALKRADVLVLATPWEGYRSLSPKDLVETMRHPVVIDPMGGVEETLGCDRTIAYYAVGRRSHGA